LDDVGVAQNLEDAYLSGDPLDVSLLDYFLFLKGFNGNFLARGYMYAQPHLTKGALPYRFTCIQARIPILYCPRTNSPPALLI
jgi:hypothetical protein